MSNPTQAQAPRYNTPSYIRSEVRETISNLSMQMFVQSSRDRLGKQQVPFALVLASQEHDTVHDEVHHSLEKPQISTAGQQFERMYLIYH